jgi:hypothetical protein
MWKFGWQFHSSGFADSYDGCFARHGYGWDERDLNVDVEQRRFRLDQQ